VVVWTGGGQDGSGYYGVFGQRYDSAGSAQGSEFQVNTYTTGYQYDPRVAVHSDGDFVVVWESGGQDGSSAGIFGQRYDSAGSAQGSEFQVNTYTTSFQVRPAVAAESDGDFVVVWNSDTQDGSGAGIFGQRYAAAIIPAVSLLGWLSLVLLLSAAMVWSIRRARPRGRVGSGRWSSSQSVELLVKRLASGRHSK
jgi:hypothetical protein